MGDFFRKKDEYAQTYELRLDRLYLTDKSTIGTLSDVEHGRLCYILEDPVREKKIPKITAIPEGRYEVVISLSPRFGKPLPELLDVPEYTGVRIHPGNFPEDTDGCLIPGLEYGLNIVRKSRIAFKLLMTSIQEAQAAKKRVYITVSNDSLGEIRAA